MESLKQYQMSSVFKGFGHYISSISIFLTINFIFLFFAFSFVYSATFQEKLEEKFNVVDTFDDSRDWKGGVGYFFDDSSLPVKENGEQTIWHMYSNDTEAKDYWIKDHGPEFRLHGSGKSLCINYNNFVGGVDGYGPSRLGTFLGNGVDGKSGYKKIFIFFVFKFHPGFYSMKSSPEDNEFEYVGTHKFLEVASGFTDINRFGTDQEVALTCDTEQIRKEYGLHDTIFNTMGGGLSNGPNLFFVENTFKAIYDNENDCWKYDDIPFYFLNGDGGDATFNSQYLNSEWIAVEFILDIGTTDQDDGSVEIFLYNLAGEVTGHNSRSGYNKLVEFDHYYNKVVIGGNRLGAGYHSDPGDSNENRFYVDDFIIHGSRIGPTYFSLLGGGDETPSAPSQLKVVQ